MSTPNPELPHLSGDAPLSQEAIPVPQGNTAEYRYPLFVKGAAITGIASMALALTGCLQPSGEAVNGQTVQEQTLAVADEPGAQAMFASLKDAMGNTVHVTQPSSHEGTSVDTDAKIKLSTEFNEWAIRNGANPAPLGLPAPGDAVLTRAGDIGYIYKVTTSTDQFGGTATKVITLVGGTKLSLGDLIGHARAQLPFPEGDTQPRQAAAPTKTPASHSVPKGTPTAETKSTPTSIEKARTAVVNTINRELDGKGGRGGHAGQSPYTITASGHSEWPELMDYISKANSGNWLGHDPDWCSLLVSFMLDKAGHPLSGGDSGNPTALYRVANVFGSPPIKDLTLQEWVIKNGTYWSYGETGTPPKAGDILFLSDKGDGTTIQHTGIVIGMDGDKVVYAAGNDGSNRGFNKHTTSLKRLQEDGTLVAISDPFTKKAAGGNISGGHETPPLDPNMLEGFMRSVLQQESGAHWGTPPNSATASGGFQITKSLWNGHDGYAAAYQAPPEVQWKFAQDLFTQYYNNYYANRDMNSMSGKFNVWDYLAIAWYAGPNALTPQYLAKHSLTQRQGPNGEYPSIVEYAEEVVDGNDGSTHPGMMHYVRAAA